MLFRVDPSSGLAIYDQVVRQVKFAVAGQAIRAGELVPSVRELARELAINPNTVARAYRQLQDEGILAPVRGTGLAVAAGAARYCRSERVKLIRQRLREVLLEGRHGGLEADQLRRLVENELVAIEKKEPR